MSAISRYQPLIIFDIDQLSDQSSKSEIKKGILVFELPRNLIVYGFDNNWDWEGFRLKNIRIRRTVSRKIKKN